MRREKGFTLLEVLVASVILFASIATATAIFSSSVAANRKATAYVKSTIYGSYIFEHVTYKVKQGEVNGNGHWDGVDYSWSVTNSRVAQVHESLFKDSQAQRVSRPVTLSNVDVRLGKAALQQVFSIQVVSWNQY